MRQIVFAVSLSLFTGHVAAQPSVDSIEELLKLTKAEALLSGMSGNVENSMRASMVNSLKGKQVTPDQQKALDEMPRRLAALMNAEFRWGSLKPEYVKLYRESFDQSEVDGMIAFYKTPAGQAVVNKMPVVLQKTMVIVQSRMQALMPRIQALVKEMVTQAKGK